MSRPCRLEPERSTSFFNIAPRLAMNIADVQSTGLIQTGSRVWYYLYAAGSPAQVKALERAVKLERGQRIDTLDTGRPEVRGAVDRAQRFLGSLRSSPRSSPASPLRSALGASSSATSTAAR